MKFMWEVKDVDDKSDRWGLMARCSDEIVIIGGRRVTSLRDGHSWEYDSYEKLVEEFNKHGYEPVLAPVNPSVIVKEFSAKKFNYGAGLG